MIGRVCADRATIAPNETLEFPGLDLRSTLFALWQLDGHVGGGAHGTRATVTVDASSEHGLKYQKEFFGKHGVSHQKRHLQFKLCAAVGKNLVSSYQSVAAR
jgi:hypothetical protein